MIEKYRESSIGNKDKPEYLFVFPSLNSTRLPCSNKTIDYIMSLTKLDSAKVCFTSFILESIPESKIKADDKKKYHESFLEWVAQLSPRVMITFGDMIPKYLLNLSTHESKMDSNHGTFFSWNNRYLFPVHGFKNLRISEYKEMIEFDLSERLKLDTEKIKLPKYEIIETVHDIESLFAASDSITLDIESSGLDYYSDTIYMIGFKLSESNTIFILGNPSQSQIDDFLSLIVKYKLNIIGHNIKFDMKFLILNSNFSDQYHKFADNIFIDTMALYHLKAEYRLNLKHLANKHIMRLGNNAYKGDDGFQSVTYLVEDVFTTYLLYENFNSSDYPFLYKWTNNMNKLTLFMELAGFHFENHQVDAMKKEFESELERLENEILGDSSDTINLNSNLQLAEFLVANGVSLTELTASGAYSVSKNSLSAIEHPIAQKIVAYKEIKSNYSKSVKKFSGIASNYLHSNFNITGTVTGRLSSSNPNFQNFPNKFGFKKIFTSRFDNGVLALVDFAQAELRVAALISEDEKMAQALSSRDGHSAVASLVFGREIDKNNPDDKKLRNIAKGVGFGLLYGSSDYGVMKNLETQGLIVSLEDVKNTREKYFGSFPNLKKWIKRNIRQANQLGYITSPLGRIYRFDYMLKNGFDKSVERGAVNYPVQGTSADLLGYILIYVQNQLIKNNMKSMLVNTVHDSGVADIYPGEEFAVYEIFQQGFESLYEIDWMKNHPLRNVLPFAGDFTIGNTWFDVEGKEEGSTKINELPLNSLGVQ